MNWFSGNLHIYNKLTNKLEGTTYNISFTKATQIVENLKKHANHEFYALYNPHPTQLGE